MNSVPTFQLSDFTNARKMVCAPDPKFMDIVWLKMVRACFHGSKYFERVMNGQQVAWAEIAFGTNTLYLFPSRDVMNYFDAHTQDVVREKVPGKEELFAYLKSYDIMAKPDKSEINYAPIYLKGFPEAKPGSNDIPPGLKLLPLSVNPHTLVIADSIEVLLAKEAAAQV